MSSFGLSTITSIPSTLMSGVTSIANAANSTLTGIISSFPSVPQYYFTVPFPNNKLVLYKLQITQPNNPNNSSVGPNVSPYTYTFPLSPSAIRKATTSLVNYYDVNGGATSQLGVQRIVDQYGMTPPVITISGTTGFQFHNLDGFQWSGASSFALLVQILRNFVNLVNQVITSQQTQNMPTLSFYDGWTGEVFQVVPYNMQSYSMDSNRPIIQTYDLTLLVTVENSGPQVAQNDALSQTLLLSKAILTSGFLTYWNSILDNLPTGSIS